jgi:hypothetical protein
MLARIRQRMWRPSALMVVALVVALSFPASSAADTTTFKAQFLCNERGAVYPLEGARVEFRKRGWDLLPKWFDDDVLAVMHADADGRVEVTVRGDEDDFYFRIKLDDDSGVRAEEWWALWSWYSDTATNQNDVPVQDYGGQQLGNGTIPPECAAFEGARRAYHGYRSEIGELPPYGDLLVNVNSPSSGVPFARYVTIHWPPRYPPGTNPGEFETTSHEFAHTVRHAFDGSAAHFYADVIDFKYLQRHSPCKRVSSSAFAFNEGWAEYWARDFGPAPNCPGIPATDFRVEGNVAAALDSLDRRCPGVDRPQMVDVLRRNRGRIHSFEDFRRALGCPLFYSEAQGVPAPDKAFSRRALLGIAERQIRALGRKVASLNRDLRLAKSVADRPNPCRPKPCLDALQREIRPSLLTAELGQARLLRKALAVQASPQGMKRLGAPQSQRFGRHLAARKRAFRLGSAKIGKRALGEALRAARPILANDRSPAVAAIGRALRTTLGTFRSGQLPAGFAIPTPGGSRLVTGTPLPGPAPPPAPAPPVPVPPLPGAAADLVIDRVYLTAAVGWEWNVEVRNAGITGAAASKTGITQLGLAEVLVDTPALAAGASVTVKAECIYGQFAEATARADATNVVDESNEANNDRAADPGGGTGGRCRYP